MPEVNLGVKKISGKSRRVTLTNVFPSDWEWVEVIKIQTNKDEVFVKFRKV